ncbi:MAG TPA: ABC transporter substrate-binding protein [Symbiobacteriaceae bacterium]|nr:ABC transporter substrate-binding protein [Symbiobacteriaceae bacterium]
MKRFVAIMIAILCVSMLAMPASAARPEIKYPVTFNGHPVSFDTNVEVINGRTWVPFRAIFEKMGAEVNYDGNTNTITATRGSTKIILTPGSETALVNGSASTLPGKVFINADSRTMVPLRFVSEAMGADVSYNDATTAITIVDKNWPPKPAKNELYLALWNKPEGKFNPIVSSDTYSSNIGGMEYDGLWRYDERYTPIPALAEAFEWETETKLVFYLRKDVKFFDGTPLTAKDVIFTYKAIWHPKYIGPRNTGWEDVKGWEEYTKGIKGESKADFENGFVTTSNLEGLYAPDDYTVVFELKNPNVPFLFNVAYGIMDSSKYSQVPVQHFGTANDPYNLYPNGTGAYQMENIVEGQYYTLKANPNYWSGKPYIDKVIWRVVDSAVAVGEMQLGTLDYVEASAPELDAYQAMSNVNIIEFPDMLYQQMVFNTAEGPTADKLVRQAIAYGTDRPGIIHTLMKDHASAMLAPIHPLSWGYTLDVEPYDYNPEKSAQLLDQAGWKLGKDGIREKDGKKLSLRLIYPNVGNPVRQATAPFFQQMMKKIGVDIQLVGYDWTAINTKVFEEYDFDLYFIGFQLGNSDPDPTGLWDKQSIAPGAYNAARWWTEKSEQLIAAGKRTGDIEQRMEIYHEWQQHFSEEMPAVIFYAVNSILVSNKRLQNFKPGPQGLLWNLEELWLSK